MASHYIFIKMLAYHQERLLKTLDGDILKDFTQIKQHTSLHFENLYTTSKKDENQLIEVFLQHIPRMITEEDNVHLDKHIEEA